MNLAREKIQNKRERARKGGAAIPPLFTNATPGVLDIEAAGVGRQDTQNHVGSKAT